MIARPRLNFFQAGLDNAIALSLGLTSYVSSSRRVYAGETIYCDGETPRDVLDQFILAWEKNNRPSIEASLGPNAKAALQSLLEGRTWAAMRADVWTGKSRGDVAMGYRFDNAGRLTKPAETLIEEDAEHQVVDHARIPENVELDAFLTNSSGDDCGKRKIKFFSPKDTVVLKYFIDNSDLRDLLSAIAACAAVR